MSKFFEDTHASFDIEGTTAWNILSDAHKYALSAACEPDGVAAERCVGVRILGGLLQDSWSHRGRYSLSRIAYASLVQKILGCHDDPERGAFVAGTQEHDHDVICEKICALGVTCCKYLLSSFDGISTEPDYLLGISVDGEPKPKPLDKLITYFLRNAGRPTSDELELKIQALVRDSFKCALTGYVDAFAVETLVKRGKVEEGTRKTCTECLHLVPLATKAGLEDSGTNPVPLLKFLGLWETVHNMPAVHGVANVITLHLQLRRDFDLYNIWLEEIDDEPNVYRVATGSPSYWELETPVKKVSHNVTLSVNTDVVSKAAELGVKLDNLPVTPDRELVAFRAMCARVVHKAGLFRLGPLFY